MEKQRYRKGAHTTLDLKYHCVWKTKYGYPVLRREVSLGAKRIVHEIAKEKGLTIISGNVRSNHIHILISAPSYYSPSKIMQYLKGKSSYRLQRDYRRILGKTHWGRHLWSRGYFCSTVGSVTEEQIKAYIENQDDEPDTVKVWDAKDSDAFESDD